MLGKKLSYGTERKIGHMVKEMNTQKIMKYQPEKAIIETVNELWMPSFDRDVLMLMTIKEAEQLAKESFPELYPHLNQNLAQSFADDTIFHIAFKLSHQGKEVDFVDGLD